MNRTGIFATDDEKEYLGRLSSRAQATPVIAFSSRHALEEGGLSGQAWTQAKKECHRIALEHGLSEIPGWYGIDEAGEFVTV